MLQVHARRLSFGSTIVGVVVVGYKLDDRIAKTAHDQTAIGVSIALDDQPIALFAARPRGALWPQ